MRAVLIVLLLIGLQLVLEGIYLSLQLKALCLGLLQSLQAADMANFYS